MGLKQPLMQVDSVATGLSHQCALHALFLSDIVGCLNSTLGSIITDDVTVSKGQTPYCHGDTASNLYMVKSSGSKMMTPLCGHNAHISGISNAR